ncbi:MAG: PD-(D/E)XK nuclease family protein, partial [Thermoleophilia bacterium]|nr:PD-(D/E)XK nuclease family protein [Thermoleophilia bacterium]
SRLAWEAVAERADEATLEVLACRRRSLQKEVVALYDRLRGMGFECPQIDVPASPSDGGAEAALIAAVREALAAGQVVDKPGAALLESLGNLRNCLSWLEMCIPLDDRAADLDATKAFFPSRRTSSMEGWFVPVREALTRYRQVLAGVRLGPVVDAMNVLLAEFHDRYEAQKQEQGLLDFNDLELRARALVEAANSGGSGPIMPGCRVLVDEFQDTNEVQCGLVEGLGAERLLMVGDKHQSIYRFRGADVNVFSDRERRLEAGGCRQTGGVHRLTVNYRSRQPVLDFINALFSHQRFFGTQFDILETPEINEATETVAPASTSVRPAVEVVVAQRLEAPEDGGSRPAMQEAEAQVVADRIRRTVEEEGRRQCDVVLLLPAQTHVESYQRALMARGLDVYVVRGKGYYAREEVTDVVSLLRVLLNPHDDLALLAVLRSPLVGLSDDGLYTLGRQGRRQRSSLWEVARDGCPDSLGHSDRGLLAAFIQRLAQMERRVGRPGLARLIEDALEACDYDLCLLAAPDGGRRFANVRKLMRMADDFEALEGPDLAGFVRMVQSLDDLGDDEGSASTLAEAADVVRVMTVHQAKGLEFPMVVLAGLGSDVRCDTPSEFVVGEDGRVGVFLKGSKNSTYETQDLYLGPAAEIVGALRVKELEEDNRLLYVAMTRAQDRLVLVGARPQNDNLGKCRIGRIVVALGLSTLPNEGESVVLEGLDAVVETVAPPAIDAAAEITAAGERSGVLEDVGPVASGPVGGPATAAAGPPVPGGFTATGVRQVSFSALAAYHRCPRRFYFERVLGLATLPARAPASGQMPGSSQRSSDDDHVVPDETLLDEEEQRVGRDVGSLVHALLERLPNEAGRPAAERVRGVALDLIDETGLRLDPSELDRSVALTLSFWDSSVAEIWSHPAATREAPFFFALGDVMVSGIMDLAMQGEYLWRIVDYKTNALKGRSPADLAAGYELQMVTYCLAALLAGAPSVQMDLVFLERPGDPVTVRYAQEAVASLQERLGRALRGIEQGEFPMLQGEQCSWCPVAHLCVNVAPA